LDKDLSQLFGLADHQAVTAIDFDERLMQKSLGISDI
jgi:hypothetical protein